MKRISTLESYWHDSNKTLSYCFMFSAYANILYKQSHLGEVCL